MSRVDQIASPGGEAGERSETDEVEPLNMKFFKLEYKTSDLFCKPQSVPFRFASLATFPTGGRSTEADDQWSPLQGTTNTR